MNYSALIQNRKSVREFSDKYVSFDDMDAIKAYFHKARRLVPELKTELKLFGLDARAVLEGAAGYKQFLVGAPQYMVLLSEKGPRFEENAGYLMEDLILKLTEMGLDTCWLTFTDSEYVKSALEIESELEVAAIAAFGYGVKTTKRLRLNFLSMKNVDAAAKRRYMEPKRSVSELVSLDSWGNRQGVEEYIGFYDDMLWESLYAVSQAPSYLNRQAYGFVLHGGQISLISTPDEHTLEIDARLSLGIALLHFTAVAENWAGKLQWRFGEEAAKLELPEGYAVVATCVL